MLWTTNCEGLFTVLKSMNAVRMTTSQRANYTSIPNAVQPSGTSETDTLKWELEPDPRINTMIWFKIDQIGYVEKDMEKCRAWK